MASDVLGVTGALAHITELLDAETLARAKQAGGIAAHLHRTSPRSGPNLNRHKQLRSGPGEPPAIEDGVLLQELEKPPERTTGGWSTIINYVVLENGTRYMAARPLGSMTVEQLMRDTQTSSSS